MARQDGGHFAVDEGKCRSRPEPGQHPYAEMTSERLGCNAVEGEVAMADTNEYVKTVIQVLNDGQKGFADIGEHIKDPGMKSYFMTESQQRGSFARELESVSGLNDVGGTVAAPIHRLWGDLKANLGGSDHTLLETAEQGEDAAKKAYQVALDDSSVTGPIRALLQKQQTHIQASHDKVKAYRDSTN